MTKMSLFIAIDIITSMLGPYITGYNYQIACVLAWRFLFTEERHKRGRAFYFARNI